MIYIQMLLIAGVIAFNVSHPAGCLDRWFWRTMIALLLTFVVPWLISLGLDIPEYFSYLTNIGVWSFLTVAYFSIAKRLYFHQRKTKKNRELETVLQALSNREFIKGDDAKD